MLRAGRRSTSRGLVAFASFAPGMVVLMLAAMHGCAPHGAGREGGSHHAAFEGGRWFNGTDFVERTLYSVDGRFSEVRPRRIDTTYHLEGRYLIPPFGDAHSHELGDAASVEAMLPRFVEEGIFYVQVLGNRASKAQEVRHLFEGPQTLDVAHAHGGLTSTLGHPFVAFETQAMGLHWSAMFNQRDEVAASRLAENDAYWFLDAPDEVSRRWPEIVASSPDLIKIFLVDTPEQAARAAAGSMGNFGLAAETAGAVVAQAHASGLRVVAHVETAEDFRIGLELGVDGFGHLPGYTWNGQGTPDRYRLSDTDVARAARAGVFVTPTASFARVYATEFGPDGTRSVDRERKEAVDRFLAAEIQRLHRAGVRIALGADQHRETAMADLRYLRDDLQLFDDATLLALATTTTPRTIFPDRRIGRLEPGYEASFLALDANSLEDWSALEAISLRIKEGRPLKPPASAARDSVLAFVNVNVLPMDSDTARVLAAHTVVVEGGVIRQVGPSDQVSVPHGARLIEGGGRTLIPGLMDMHAHLSIPEEPSFYAEDNEASLALLLAHGVTTIRNMWGSEELLAFRDRVRAGELLGPRIFTTGPFVVARPDSLQGPWTPGDLERNPAGFRARTAEDARALVRYHQEAGYDFIKVYDFAPPVVYWAVLEEAGRLGMPVVGHVPRAVPVAAALARGGPQSLEHYSTFASLVERSDSPARGSPHWYEQAFGAYAHADDERMRVVAELVVASGIWFTPTLLVSAWYTAPQADLLRRLDQPEVLRYTSPGQRAIWRDYAEGFASNFEPWGVDMAAQRDMALRLVGHFHQAGVPLLLGTDATPALSPQGLAVHEELGLLVEAGLSPWEALRTATVNPHRYLAEEGFAEGSGMVRPGEVADLVLLEANPLDDIAYTRRISGVMTRGRWLDRGHLDALLRDVEERYRER